MISQPLKIVTITLRESFFFSDFRRIHVWFFHDTVWKNICFSVRMMIEKRGSSYDRNKNNAFQRHS